MAKVTGINTIAKNLRKADKDLLRAMRAGLIDGMAFTENKSNEIAPRDTGFLRLSSFTTDIDQNGRVQVGRVGYDSTYAPYVHEMPETNNFTTPGTGPKFLERAIKENVRALMSTMFRTMTRLLASWR